MAREWPPWSNPNIISWVLVIAFGDTHDSFEKNDILRIVRALAIFRPSLIALQMPMTDEDEIFVEKCFQRSLLVRQYGLFSLLSSKSAQELEKLISYSGTPTVVWRRTGEICLVAPEFCMLTEWPIDELMGKRKYIYEVAWFFYAGFATPHVVTFSSLKTNPWSSTGKTLRHTRSRIQQSLSIRIAFF